MRTFSIPGKPTGKGRPRATTIGGHARQYSPAKTVSYEGKVALAYRQAYPGEPPYQAGVPLEVSIVALFAIPTSWAKRRKATARWHTGMPDADNIAKIVCDALNGIAWTDDAQVARETVLKRYSPDGAESVTVTISQLDQPPTCPELLQGIGQEGA
jgi:Holliday junction resolvase RusA-like endonuclease